MPNSSSQRKTEKEIFLEVDVIDDPDARDAFLRERCGDDQALLERLRELVDIGDDEENLIPLDPNGYKALEMARDSVGRRLAEEGAFLEQLGGTIRRLGERSGAGRWVWSSRRRRRV